MIYCIQIRRKSMQTVLSIPIDFLDKNAKSKRVDVFRKMNLLYTKPEHKLLLHHSGSSTSSSPPSSSLSSPLSPCTIYSRSGSSNISSVDTDTKHKIIDILTSFSQRLLCQPSKYFSQKYNVLQCNVMLLQWLNQYLNSSPKTYIPKSSFTLENLLGEGNYGIVYKGKLSINADDESNSSDTEIAIKTLKGEFGYIYIPSSKYFKYLIAFVIKNIPFLSNEFYYVCILQIIASVTDDCWDTILI